MIQQGPRMPEVSTASPVLVKKRARCRNSATALRFQNVGTKEGAQGGAASDTKGRLLVLLPREVLLRILRMLSPQDLTACSCTCRALRGAGDDEILWRRLYFARWGQFEGCESNFIHSRFWKATYMERDAREYEQRVPREQDGALLPVFHAMQLSQRALSVKAEREPTMTQQTSSCQEQVAALRRARGFSDEAVEAPPNPMAATLQQFGDLFVDVSAESQGWVHVCDHTCSEVVESGGFMVCRLTGRAHGVALCDEDAALGDLLADEPGDADFQPGWLGRAYEEGYACDDGDTTSLVSPLLLQMGRSADAQQKRKRKSLEKDRDLEQSSFELMEMIAQRSVPATSKSAKRQKME